MAFGEGRMEEEGRLGEVRKLPVCGGGICHDPKPAVFTAFLRFPITSETLTHRPFTNFP
jgi:hypothetical protein